MIRYWKTLQSSQHEKMLVSLHSFLEPKLCQLIDLGFVEFERMTTWRVLESWICHITYVVSYFGGSARKRRETTKKKHVQCRFNGGMFILEPAEPKFQKLRERLLDDGSVDTVFSSHSHTQKQTKGRYTARALKTTLLRHSTQTLLDKHLDFAQNFNSLAILNKMHSNKCLWKSTNFHWWVNNPTFHCWNCITVSSLVRLRQTQPRSGGHGGIQWFGLKYYITCHQFFAMEKPQSSGMALRMFVVFAYILSSNRVIKRFSGCKHYLDISTQISLYPPYIRAVSMPTAFPNSFFVDINFLCFLSSSNTWILIETMLARFFCHVPKMLRTLAQVFSERSLSVLPATGGRCGRMLAKRVDRALKLKWRFNTFHRLRCCHFSSVWGGGVLYFLFKPLSGSQQLRLVFKKDCCRCSFQQGNSWLMLVQVVRKSCSSRGCTEGHPTSVLLYLRKSTTSSHGMWTILPCRQTNMRLGHVVRFSVI